MARGKEMEKGFLPFAAVKSLVTKGASAVLCDDGEAYRDIGVPVLKVHDVRSAILAIGQRQRRCYAGRVVGITGSAGKTTAVAMLAHALSYNSSVGQTQGSANLPVGIAWNIASMPQEAPYWVVEMAIGSMAQNTALARLILPLLRILLRRIWNITTPWMKLPARKRLFFRVCHPMVSPFSIVICRSMRILQSRQEPTT